MRKKWLNILALAVMMAVFAACNRPKVIPDRELKDIFKEIFISNAYVSSNYRIKTDSMDMYNPILKKYGYDAEDLVYTMANFTKRKSMRLSDVVEEAIKDLETEEKYLLGRVAALDTIDLRAQRMFSKTVYQDSLITAKRIADTAKLRINIPVEYGVYNVKYYYHVDSLDQNKNHKTTFTFRDSVGKATGTTTNWMTSTKRQSYTAKLNAKNQDRMLEVLFGNYPAKDMKTPMLEIDSFFVVYYPPIEQAIDLVNKNLLGYTVQFDKDKYGKNPEDSSALRIHPPRIPEERGDND